MSRNLSSSPEYPPSGRWWKFSGMEEEVPESVVDRRFSGMREEVPESVVDC